MPVPGKIKIRRIEDYRTHDIGLCADGNQFMAFVTGSFPMPPPKNRLDEPNHMRWYAILHIFDPDGKHLTTKAWFAGTSAGNRQIVSQRANDMLYQWLQDLGPVTHCDVCIELFEVEVDGRKFGLMDTSEPDGGTESITLMPNDLIFFPPWDGDYST
jgi:formate hydrogenlyase regulatory protein HycA